MMLAAPPVAEFGHVGVRDGLSNSQVNVVYEDSRGFVWIGTQSGLNRYDGYRFKHYFYKSTDHNSLPNNWISEIQEATGGRLLLRTPMGYTIYEPGHETFDNDASIWMEHRQLKGHMDVAHIDRYKNWAVIADGIGLYYARRNAGTELFAFGKQLPMGKVSAITEYGRSLLLTYDDGRLVCVIPSEHRVAWVNNYIAKHRTLQSAEGFTTYVSRFGNYWVMGSGQVWIYNQKLQRWFDNVVDYLKAQDYTPIPNTRILAKSIVEDYAGGLWMGTEHRGLFRINYSDKSVQQYDYRSDRPTSLADNTVQSLYLDSTGNLWVGTYKNGLSYYSPNVQRFATEAVGDVCTIVEDGDGRYWCGTNDNGLMIYDPKTDQAEHYGTERTGLGSEVVVSSTRMKDGSLWFGTYNGGLACYKQGKWSVWRVGDGSGLSCDNVWSLCEAPDGRLAIATLGGGLQLYDPRTKRFETYRMNNSALPSDYLNSVSVMKDKRLLIGHSVYYSILDLKTRKITNFDPKQARGSLASPAINQAIQDSRGIIWLASASGACAYAPGTRQLTGLDWMNGTTGAVSCSVVEDKNGIVWLVSDHGVSRIQVKKKGDEWEYYTELFDEYDGLQKRQFNFRSILLARNGDVIVGGQDGINILPVERLTYHNSHDRVLFAGLRLFDHDMEVGDKYNGHVVLSGSLNEHRRLELKHDENDFTVLLATDNVSVPATSRFFYRLKGFTEDWQMTPQGQPQVTFTNLAPGSYVLEVRAVVRNGAISDAVSTLEIKVCPPFYRSWWAYCVYLLLFIGLALLVRRYMLRRQLAELRMLKVRQDAERERQMDEMKLTFFTNVSHELRTPLTLIVSPLAAMLKGEKDEKKRSRLALVYRNAERLFELVNQLLDFRKMDQKKQVLEPVTGDIVSFVHDIVRGYLLLSSRQVTLSFESQIERLSMSFDPDKLRKVVDNLLSNAFKYTQKGGSVKVTLAIGLKALDGVDAVVLSVADTGDGVPDEDKAHIFQPFYQASNHTSNPYGGSGVGLSLVSDFVKMHGGTVHVEDNAGGGSVFVVALPIRHDATLAKLYVPESAEEKEEAAPTEDEETAKVSKPKGRRADVLLVDDADDFLVFMSEVLSERYKIRTAHDGVEALERIKEKRPDIILSDVMMPRMDGRELCRKLKSDEQLAEIPFVMLTARMADAHVVEGMQLGADDYLTKPFNLDVLFLRMDNLLKWHHAASEKKQLIEPALTPVEVTSQDEQFVRAATAFVEKHLGDDVSVEDLSAELGVSRVQLYRRILSLTGSTPSEFIRTLRLRHAERLLRESQLTVSEIAYRVGFGSPRSFSKYFAEMYGMPPSQYAKGENNPPESAQ